MGLNIALSKQKYSNSQDWNRDRNVAGKPLNSNYYYYSRLTNFIVWNKELLYVGGLLSRSAYEFELSAVRQHWETAGSGEGEEMQRRLISRVLHALKFFMFYTSTPSPDVSSLMEAAFFACSPSGNFPLITTKGVRNAADVRLPDSTFSGFLKDIPTLPEEIMNGASLMISGLQARGLIKAITFHDVLQELQSRPLTQIEFVACLNWWVGVFREGDRDRLLPIQAQLINSVVLSIDEGNGQKIITLSAVKSFINPRTPSGNIPPEGPLPEHLLPISISKLFKPEVLSSCFPWTEFTIVQWVRFLCESGAIQVEFDLNSSPSWAERVFGMISRAWPTLSSTSKTDIIQLLRLKTCIPTSSGMMLPEQAYFPNVNIFGDLPIVVFPGGLIIKGTLERVLQDIGVRKHVELQLIFNRCVNHGNVRW